VEERGEVCLAEEVERLRRLGLSDEEVASRMGVDVSWVRTLISPGEDEADSGRALREAPLHKDRVATCSYGGGPRYCSARPPRCFARNRSVAA
jgi:hypothetical protein